MKRSGEDGQRGARRHEGEARASLMPRIVRVADIPAQGLSLSIAASEAERAAIAAADGLVALDSLTAELKLTREGEDGVAATGRLRARMTATCVVSLDPFESAIEADIGADFAMCEGAPATPGVSEANGRSVLALDEPDPIYNGELDVGALVEEFFVLSLDPHPRKPGAAFDTEQFSSGAAQDATPFAALGRLKIDR